MMPRERTEGLFARAILRMGEADELEARALEAAQRGDAPKAWVLEQRAKQATTEGRALAREAFELNVAARVVEKACRVCAAAVRSQQAGGR